MTSKTTKTAPYYVLKKGPLPDQPSITPYRFAEMEVGHYFDVPRDRDHVARVRASEWGKKLARTYSVRRITEQGEPRTRVHRIA